MKGYDLVVTIDNGIITIEDMSTKAREGLRREVDIISIFYFFEDEYEVTEADDSWVVTGFRRGLFCIPENKVIPRNLLDMHNIPTDRLVKAFRTPMDFFRKEPSCYTSDERIIFPLQEAFKSVKLVFPKAATVRMSQDKWKYDETKTQCSTNN